VSRYGNCAFHLVTSDSPLISISAYNASKAAANHLTESIAFEFTTTVDAKIRVNAIAPGVFPSEMTAENRDEKNQSDLSDKLPTMAIPAARPGEAEDMVRIGCLVDVSLN
jgi:NAD(P)-dependent dehydrogenase (short-subunit alcohol dehydrogenase family)